MSNIYAISDIYEGFKSFNLDILDVIEAAPETANFDQLMSFEKHNLSLKDWWPGFEVELYSPNENDSDETPDLHTWVGPSLYMSPRALRLLAPSLEEYGEILPITVNGESWGIFNCLRMIKADPSKTYRPKMLDEFGAAEKIGFYENASENRVFKSPDEPCLTLFCNEWFKLLTEGVGLSGVNFKSVE